MTFCVFKNRNRRGPNSSSIFGFMLAKVSSLFSCKKNISFKTCVNTYNDNEYLYPELVIFEEKHIWGYIYEF